MACMSWNCRGLGHPKAVRALHYLVKSHKPLFIFLIETKLWKSEWEPIKLKLGYQNGLFVDARGRKGGLALLWPNNLKVSVLSFSSHHIEAMIEEDAAPPWRFVGFYGHHIASLRKHSWSLLRLIHGHSYLPSIFIGDFNEVLAQHEHSSRRVRPQHQINLFRDAVDDCHLLDMGFKGYPFTWKGNFIAPFTVRSRLDRGLCSTDWLCLFPDAEITHLSINRSDHLPLLLKWKSPPRGSYPVSKRNFRFESQWCLFEGCKETIAQAWSTSISSSTSIDPGNKVFEAIKATRLGLLKWKRIVVGDVPKRIREKQEVLDGLDQGIITNGSKSRAALVINEIDRLRGADEMYWQQRAKAFWLIEGDRCTKYFHAKASMRKKNNDISGLMDSNNIWITDMEGIKRTILNFYQSLFTSSTSTISSDICLDTILPTVGRSLAEKMVMPCNREEVMFSLNSMTGLKTPGPDGLPAMFYQKYWDICGEDVFNMVCSFMNEGTLLKKLNFTHITLIPKVERPINLTQFRPISLCNVTSKIISKVLANRLKLALPSVISASQSAFVPQRLITDNVLMAFEAHHFIKNRKTGNMGFMSLKLDMEKAYDRIEWNFLRAVMIKLGFPITWVDKVMVYVESVSYSVLINGEQTGFFKPGRGLRQGDPLSPYLFILCTEGLIGMINDAVTKGDLHGMKMGRSNTSISHLLFADDSLMFGCATVKEAEVIMSILKVYESQSGQKINLHKSAAYFSPNVDDQLKTSILQVLEMVEVKSHGKYLGLPSVIGASKTEIFSSIKERVKVNVEGWQSKLLSKAGKEVLIKSVIQAIPLYAMQCFQLPLRVCNDLNSMTSNFWWSSSSSQKKIHWASWSSLCRPKDCGGLGFKDLHRFNMALLCKQAWRIASKPDSPLAKMFKGKYYPETSFFRASLGSKPSFTWRSILAARDILANGVAWVIGNGKSVHVWSDRWTSHTNSHRLITPACEELKDMVVADLIDIDTGKWKEELLREIFYDVDCEAILQVKLNRLLEDDHLIWFKHPQGLFSVKGAYTMLCPQVTNPESPSNTESSFLELTKLWKTKLPGKIKHFLWRVYHDNLPTCENLIKRKVNIISSCKFCGNKEDSLHLFLYCPFTRAVCSGLSLSNLPSETTTTKDLFMGRWWGPDDSPFQLWAIAMWELWHQRNLVLYGKETKSPNDICTFVSTYMTSLVNAKDTILVPPYCIDP